MRKFSYTLLIVILFSNLQVIGQSKTSACKQFKKLSCPEKCWVIKHVFIAKKAWKITQFVRLQTDSVQKSNLLDGDANGGQVDAFRHAYWMAMLSQKISWRKAYSLGKAHEKGNYLDYKKHRLEEGTLPDKISSDMDLWNNDIGIQIGTSNKNISEDSLKVLVIKNILEGKMKMIKKNKQGEFLDNYNNIISKDSIKCKWENKKVLINTNK
ncbi:MAG: hypothetical protein NTZ33_12005 [Bacteroidetes bacterium]|nr:hypothetical protein [Bacteroidota bacterium]